MSNGSGVFAGDRYKVPAVEALTADEWEIYSRVILGLTTAGIDFLVVGGFALYYHTGKWRQAKDLDFAVRPRDRWRARKVLLDLGLVDIFEDDPYDQGWIYRSIGEGVTIDLIWRMANYAAASDWSWRRRTIVSNAWFESAVETEFLGMPIKVVSAAHLIWMKIHIVWEKRCDWPHLAGIIRATGGELDWDLLLDVLEDEWRLLDGLISFYDEVCPGERHFVPDWLRRSLIDRRLTSLDTPGAPSRQLRFHHPEWLPEPHSAT